MRGAWAVCKREFAGYFTTPVGYVVLGVYATITGLGFVASFLYYARITQSPADFDYQGVPDLEETMLSPFLIFCGQMVLFITPLITMRLLAEEKNRGTMELLLTHPLRDRDIILGKYFAALAMAFLLMIVVGVHMGLVAWLTTVEPAVLVFGLLAVFLMSAAFLSLGLFISAATRNQVTAATVTLGAFFLSYVLGSMGKDLSPANPAPESWSEGVRNMVGFVYGLFHQIVQELPVDAHAQNMTQGIVEPADLAYYVVFAAFFLFLTFRALEARLWRST